ncbi:hypothetical protein E2562_016715 [Oryza meyeriana var. granulata]|uniref:Uncharacterized protein n=1 Tax=Oryza meyeriana var. granulata TaxID=110450 RepID=A0A6G1EL35_9ORYZ|nr:hypothetical protein E2562_016715 [Oryza meyeriana var. granulata]
MVSTMYKEAAVTGASGGDGEHYARLIRELCALLVTIISPSAASAASQHEGTRPTTRLTSTGFSPAAAASMLLGASMALMLCGSVTFAIGFLLMPWVAGIALLFGFAAAVSTLSSGVFGNGKASSAYKDAMRGRASSSPTSPASHKPIGD